MKRSEMKIRLNLASDPLRNRRFYLTVLSFLGCLTIIFLGLSLQWLVRYRLEAGRLRAELVRLARMEDAARREDKQYSARVASFSRELTAELNQTNSVIQLKSFPWSDFFFRLEKSLPAGCYLTSLNFSSSTSPGLQIRMKLVSPDFSSLLQAMAQLREAGFNSIRVENEDQSPAGLFSEVTMTYERTD